MDSEKARFIALLIEYPEETALAEYKSAVSFEPKSDFAAKLVKHIIGHANAGGGYIVIGFQESQSGNLAADANLTVEVSKSYETTRLSQTVDAFLAPGQRIAIQVHKIPFKDRIYPVVSVQGFQGSPFFCGRDFTATDGKPILRKGAVYVRDMAAKTVIVSEPEHWNVLLKSSVAQKQSEAVEQIRAVLGELGVSPPPRVPTADQAVQSRNQDWYDEESAKARAQLREVSDSAGSYEVVHYPVGASRTWDQAELLSAARAAVLRNTGWPVGVVMTKPEFAPTPTVSGIRAAIKTLGRFDYWALNRSGAYYFLRLLDEDTDLDSDRRGDKRWVYFDTRIWRIAETLLHCSALYKALGLSPETPIFIRISHFGLKGRFLGVADRMRMMHWERKSEENNVSWTKTVPLGSLDALLEDLAREASREIFMLFEYWEPEDSVFKEILAKFVASRI